jgi:pterin-4a-carbinolamine dehydratase
MDELVPWLVLTHPIDGLTAADVELAKSKLLVSADGVALARSSALGIG